MKRGKRGSKTTKSNFKTNMKTVGLKTVDIVFGIPHFAIALAGHEVAQLEAVARWAIARKDIHKSTDRRKALSEDYRERMEEAVDQSLEYAGKGLTFVANKVKAGTDALAKNKPVAKPDVESNKS